MLKLFILRIWSKISVKISRMARRYVLTVLYYIVLPIIGLAGSRMTLKKPNGNTMWHDWNEKNSPDLTSKQSEKNWLLTYLSWSFSSKNFWAVFLLPFILILKIAEEPSDRPTPESFLMYTLY